MGPYGKKKLVRILFSHGLQLLTQIYENSRLHRFVGNSFVVTPVFLFFKCDKRTIFNYFFNGDTFPHKAPCIFVEKGGFVLILLEGIVYLVCVSKRFPFHFIQSEESRFEKECFPGDTM